MIERGHHDMGGLPAGKIDPDEHDYADWERRVDALYVLLIGIKGTNTVMTMDELRKNVEALPPEAYEAMSYYERWVTSITQTLLQRGVITTDELARKMIDRVSPRSHHDLGGLPASNVQPQEHDYAEWERRVDALEVLLRGIRGTKMTLRMDERRKNVEGLPPKAYDGMSYYERWIAAITLALIQRGVVSSEELARKIIEVQKRG